MVDPRQAPLTVIGIDAATQPKKTGLARGCIAGGKLIVEAVELGSQDPSVSKVVASWIRGPTLLAIDAPLGWPASMGAALAGHRAGQEISLTGNEMFARLTDRIVHETVKKKPLDIGADRIARTALTALRVMQEVRDATGLAVPLSWAPHDAEVSAVEVYPAATLIGRGLSTVGYKKDDDHGRAARKLLAKAVAREVELPALDRVVDTDHALDAVLCLVAALDYVRGEVVQPPPSHAARVRAEGWIWFKAPAGSARPPSIEHNRTSH